jgi:hypothetical protein
MMVPTVHLNGTSRTSLVADYEAAYEAVQAALTALCAAAPNGRDYYPQGPHAYGLAEQDHYVRLAHLKAVADDLENILIALSDCA